MWQQIVDAIRDFFNQPVPIIGCTIGALLILILTIISKTSIGKKSLLKLKGMYAEIVAKYKKFEEESEKQIESLKNEYETKLALIESKKEETEQLLLLVCENIHNAKVKQLVADYKAKAQSYIADISSVVAEKEKEIKAECESKLAEYENLIQTKIDELDSKMEALKDGKNTDTIKEAL